MTIEAANQSMRHARPDPAAAHAATRGDTEPLDPTAARKGFVLFAVFAAWLHSFFGAADAAHPRPGRVAEDLTSGPDPLPTPAVIAGAPTRAGAAADAVPPAPAKNGADTGPDSRPGPVADADPAQISSFDPPAAVEPGLIAASATPSSSPAVTAPPAQAATPPTVGDVATKSATPAPVRPDTPTDPDTPFPEETALDANLAQLIASLDARLVGLDGLEVRQITDMLVGDVLREVPLAQLERMIALAGDNPTGILARVVEMLETPANRAGSDAFDATSLSFADALSGDWPTPALYSDEPVTDPALLAPVLL